MRPAVMPPNFIFSPATATGGLFARASSPKTEAIDRGRQIKEHSTAKIGQIGHPPLPK